MVTVLFCDLVGSTARAERMDPEDVRTLLSSYHARVRRELERFGGTVEKFIGDAVMALFGAPVAHEDDPERAVRAAIAIREWAAEDGALQVRIGITTGEALVALGARPAAGEGMASGDVVNTAARLQSAAPVNGILVDETTHRATDRAIEYGERRGAAAKGKAEAVSVWDVLQPRGRVHVERGGRAPLVGRGNELEVLTGAFRRVREDHEPQLVTLVGVPGIGKSRLVYELFKAIETGDELTFWRQGRSLSYGEGVSFWALGEIVKAHAGVLETDDEVDAATKLRETVAALVSDAEDAQRVERHLRPLLGLEDGDDVGSNRRGEAFAAWRRFLEALAEQRPLVLVFEDLHFADDGLLDFVDYLADWVSGLPVLIIATARPELLARRPGWGGGKANAVTLSLAALSDDETAQLMHSLLERPVLSVQVQATLLARAGGNPLYAEEFVHMLAERRSADELPETVHGLIAARIDALPAEEKALLQDAAVLGRVFWLGAAAALAGTDPSAAEERLHSIERKEFVRRERRSSVIGEAEYAFHHLLVRDVAYGQIPRTARAEKHRQAAQWLESLGRPADHAELLAHHYVSALELLRAAGRPTTDLREPARLALADAGDRAFGLHAYASAAGFYGGALDLWEGSGRDRLLLRYGRSLSFVGDGRFRGVLEEAANELLAAGDREMAAEAHAFLTEALSQAGDRDAAHEHIERAVGLVRDAATSASKVKVLAEWSRLLSLAGKHDEGLRIALEAFAAAEALGLTELAARTLNTAAAARSRLGDQIGAIADQERSIEIALSIGSPEAGRGYHNLHLPRWWLGDLRGAVDTLSEAVRVSERFGALRQASISRAALAWLRFHTADWDEALTGADAVIAAVEAGASMSFEHQPRLLRARIRVARGQPEDLALADLRRALEIGRTNKDPQVVWQVLAHAARLSTELGRLEEARAAAGELVVLLEGASSDAVLLLVLDFTWAAESLGFAGDLRQTLAANTTLPDVWRRPFEAALDGDWVRAADLYGALGHVDEAYARLRAAETLVAGGDRVEAEVQRRRALDLFRALGATRYVRAAETLRMV